MCLARSCTKYYTTKTQTKDVVNTHCWISKEGLVSVVRDAHPAWVNMMMLKIIAHINGHFDAHIGLLQTSLEDKISSLDYGLDIIND